MIETQTETNDDKSRMQTCGRPTTNLLQHQQQYSRDRDLSLAFISFLRFQSWKANIQILFCIKIHKYSFGYITFEFQTTHCVDDTDHNQFNLNISKNCDHWTQIFMCFLSLKILHKNFPHRSHFCAMAAFLAFLSSSVRLQNFWCLLIEDNL